MPAAQLRIDGLVVCRCACMSSACVQVNQLLEVGDKNAGMQKYMAMDKWANQLKSIHTSVCNKVY